MSNSKSISPKPYYSLEEAVNYFNSNSKSQNITEQHLIDAVSDGVIDSAIKLLPTDVLIGGNVEIGEQEYLIVYDIGNYSGIAALPVHTVRNILNKGEDYLHYFYDGTNGKLQPGKYNQHTEWMFAHNIARNVYKKSGVGYQQVVFKNVAGTTSSSYQHIIKEMYS